MMNVDEGVKVAKIAKVREKIEDAEVSETPDVKPEDYEKEESDTDIDDEEVMTEEEITEEDNGDNTEE